MVSRSFLLSVLPPSRDEWVLVTSTQTTGDIISRIVHDYEHSKKYYDCIARYFVRPTPAETCDYLYEWCRANIEYREEPGEEQTVSIPTGIIERGFGDCKAYASLIGGLLGAINRLTDYTIPWQFCFASYDPKVKEPYHVFISAYDDMGPIWVDPTPGSGRMEPTTLEYRCPDADNCPPPDGNWSVDSSGQLFFETTGSKIGAMTTGDPVTQAAMVVGNEIQAFVSNYVNHSGLKDTVIGQWIQTGGNPAQIVQLIASWITGREYTGGDYALGEIFLNRVMKQQTTSRWDTPDKIVPTAWVYFTCLLGLPVDVNTDLDTLGGSNSLEDYLHGRPEQRGKVTQAQVDRAHQLIQMLGTDKYADWGQRAWGILPYVAPIPQPHGSGYYTGQLPDGSNVVGGMVQPVSDGAAGAGKSLFSSPGVVVVAAGAALLLWWLYENY